ncbi:MAG: DUF3303 domain-containing protein [Gammaproteobacteria bacterium]|nr:DUF3303 domain-containing protein [Gammaproteobacteria bacterium]
MKYMIIERFRDANAVYARLDSKGRQLPAGLEYIDSWVSQDATHCYQLMEAQDPSLLTQWIDAWKDIVDFEVVPVVSSAEARARANPT